MPISAVLIQAICSGNWNEWSMTRLPSVVVRSVGLGSGDLRAVRRQEQDADHGRPDRDHVAAADPERQPQRRRASHGDARAMESTGVSTCVQSPREQSCRHHFQASRLLDDEQQHHVVDARTAGPNLGE
jgi:hypothetical protein